MRRVTATRALLNKMYVREVQDYFLAQPVNPLLLARRIADHVLRPLSQVLSLSIEDMSYASALAMQLDPVYVRRWYDLPHDAPRFVPHPAATSFVRRALPLIPPTQERDLMPPLGLEGWTPYACGRLRTAMTNYQRAVFDITSRSARDRVSRAQCIARGDHLVKPLPRAGEWLWDAVCEGYSLTPAQLARVYNQARLSGAWLLSPGTVYQGVRVARLYRRYLAGEQLSAEELEQVVRGSGLPRKTQFVPLYARRHLWFVLEGVDDPPLLEAEFLALGPEYDAWRK